MLHCPNEARPDHAEPENHTFFVEALLRVANDWLIRDYVMFLPNPYTCGDCGARAFDDEEDPTVNSRSVGTVARR
jgi:hypothetical protein